MLNQMGVPLSYVKFELLVLVLILLVCVGLLWLLASKDSEWLTKPVTQG